MARYPLGQPVEVSTTVRDRTGALVDPSSLTLLVKLAQADGTWLTTGTYSSPVNDSTGNYHQDVPVTDLTVTGHYQYTWTSTGSGQGVSFGDFDVFDPFEPSVLPLQDAKGMLNIAQATTAYDSELASFIATVESSLEGMTGGPVINRTVTERAELDGSYTVLQVRQRPLVAVTSIVSVASGQALDISMAALDLDANAGTIRRNLGYPFYGPFFTWLPAMTVTYVAGWGVTAPPSLNLAARIIVRHLWDTQHGPSARPSMGGDETVTLPGWGYAIPNRAAELLHGSYNGMPFMLEAYV